MLTMGQFSKVLYITIDNAHTVPQRVLDCECGQGLGGLDQIYGSNCPTP